MTEQRQFFADNGKTMEEDAEEASKADAVPGTGTGTGNVKDDGPRGEEDGESSGSAASSHSSEADSGQESEEEEEENEAAGDDEGGSANDGGAADAEEGEIQQESGKKKKKTRGASAVVGEGEASLPLTRTRGGRGGRGKRSGTPHGSARGDRRPDSSASAPTAKQLRKALADQRSRGAVSPNDPETKVKTKSKTT
jgi:hypothetical protein